MLRLFGSLRTAFQPRGFATQMNKAVQFSIKISKCQSPAEALHVLSQFNQKENMAYGLRVISRLVPHNDFAEFDKILRSKAYLDTKKSAFEHLSRMSGQEVTDLCYWDRVFYKLNRCSLSPLEMRSISSRINELVDTNGFTSTQACAVFFDTSITGRNNSALERAIAETLTNLEQTVSLASLRQVIASLDLELHTHYYKLLKAINTRLQTADLENEEVSFLVGFLRHIIQHYPNDTSLMAPIASFESRLTPDIQAFEPTDFSTIVDAYAAAPEDLTTFFPKVMTSLQAKLETNPCLFDAKIYTELSNSLISSQHALKNLCISAFARAAITSFKSAPDKGYRTLKLLDFLVTSKTTVDPTVLSEAAQILSQSSPQHKLMALGSLSSFPQVQLSEVLTSNEVRACFDTLTLANKLEVVVFCLSKPLPAEWKDLLADLEKLVITQVLALDYPYDIVVGLSKLKNYPEALYSDRLLSLKSAVSPSLVPSTALQVQAVNYVQTRPGFVCRVRSFV